MKLKDVLNAINDCGLVVEVITEDGKKDLVPHIKCGAIDEFGDYELVDIYSAVYEYDGLVYTFYTVKRPEEKSVREMLEEKVNDIFYDEQTKRGIASGDIEPLMAYMLDQKMEELSEAIVDALNWQEVWCK